MRATMASADRIRPVAEAMTPVAANVIKLLVDRPRPPGSMVEPHGSSFPSGHAAYASATAIAVVLLFTRAGRRRPLWFGAAAVVSAAMAWSRTYLQVHWLSDAVTGGLLGLAVVLLSFGNVQTAAMSGLRRYSRADWSDDAVNPGRTAAGERPGVSGGRRTLSAAGTILKRSGASSMIPSPSMPVATGGAGTDLELGCLPLEPAFEPMELAERLQRDELRRRGGIVDLNRDDPE